jgi:hypothetical protein
LRKYGKNFRLLRGKITPQSNGESSHDETNESDETHIS